MLTRRQIIQTASAVLAGAALPAIAPAAELPRARRLSEGWEHYRGGLSGIWEVWRGKAAAANVTWDKVALPHCFNAWDAVDPDRPYYQGPAWYRTTLAVQNPFPNGRTLLHFEGAGQNTEVFVGQDCVGRHVGGYDEFTCDITCDTTGHTGEVPLAVRCDNARGTETIPSDQADFNRYGGLYRHVNLVYLPAVSLERVLVAPRGDSVNVRARLRNPAGLGGEWRISTRVTGPDGSQVHASSQTLPGWTGAREVAAFTVPGAARWSPDNPNLYRCAVTLQTPHGEHRVEERFGFRTFDFPPHGVFQLNGQRLFLRGTHRHEDHAGLGAAMTDELVRREMQAIKDMGANFVRLAHYQQSALVLDLCDELGLIVWEEIPWCRGGVGGEAYREQARRMLRNMIDQHRNHPAIVFWGLGNENDWPGDFSSFDPQAVRAFVAELHQIAHREDASRLTALRRCPFAKDIPDVYSPSIWAGWYAGRYTEYRASVAKELAGVDRMLHIEWGGDSHAGRHSEDPDQATAQVATGQGVEEKDRAFLPSGGQARVSRDGDWSETYICDLFDWHLKEQAAMPALAGAAQWIFKDFSTPGRPGNPLPCVNQKGLVQRDLTPKEAYYVFQSWWAAKPMARIYGHSWPVRWGRAGEAKLVKVYSNCECAELFLNGASCGVRQRDARDFPAAGLRWRVPFLAGENVLRAVGRRGTHEVSDEIRFQYQTQPWDKPAALALEVAGRAGDVVTLRARLLDAHGVPCLDARNVVRFSVAGDAALLENLGTTTGARQLELSNGSAGIRVRLTGAKAVAGVSAPGIAPGFCEI